MRRGRHRPVAPKLPEFWRGFTNRGSRSLAGRFEQRENKSGGMPAGGRSSLLRTGTGSVASPAELKKGVSIFFYGGS